jgi:Fur family peroxide stress response transcriptional regulator
MSNLENISMRVTPQRMAILKYLEGNKDHPSAEEIYNKMKELYPNMSFATVYNTLQVLKERGGLQEITIDPSRRRYDPDINLHHHMICMKCKKISDINIDIALELPEEERRGFRVLGNHIEFYGLCPGCGKTLDEK